MLQLAGLEMDIDPTLHWKHVALETAHYLHGYRSSLIRYVGVLGLVGYWCGWGNCNVRLLFMKVRYHHNMAYFACKQRLYMFQVSW